MRKLIYVLLIMIIFQQKVSAQDAPNIGIGFRIGDLTGISVKKYFGESALEFNIGRVLRYADPHYDVIFYKFKGYNKDEYMYQSYYQHVPLAAQLHYLRQREFSFAKQLSWYYGIGAQVRMFPIKYTYKYKVYLCLGRTGKTKTLMGSRS
jgi:hypothetical protein